MVQTIQIFTDLILGTIIGEVIVWMMGLKNIIPAETSCKIFFLIFVRVCYFNDYITHYC